jgi:hyperosmotically inducible periplasmic protein
MKITLLSTALTSAICFLTVYAEDGNTNKVHSAKPDNTEVNVRDRDDKTLTPMDQSSNKEDLDLTQNIRKALVKDKNLSTTAKNIKIISIDGKVTLRGPVNSKAEKTEIFEKAQKIAGKDRVDDQLEIKTEDKK